MIKIIKRLISFSPRQLENETKAGNFILDVLSDFRELISIQRFKNSIPVPYEYHLFADNRKIRCEPNCFIGGRINGNVISSLDWGLDCDQPNINFNPKCETISFASFYFSPSLAVSRKNAFKISKAKKVIGKVKIKRVSFESFNILVGNAKNPTNIVFTHYDSIGKGAIDNASGVAVLLRTILDNPEKLRSNLFVIAGQEELSFDKPIYWGRGYKVFEEKYSSTLKRSKKIVIVDSVGNGGTLISNRLELLEQAFPIKNLKQFKNKCSIVTGNFSKLMTVYHSDLDDLKEIEIKFLIEAKSKLLGLL